MGGKSGGSQVIGYRYHEKLVVALGNPIEDVLAINFDNRGPQYGERTALVEQGEPFGVNIKINQTSLYGKEEGGVAGNIRFYFGTSYQPADPEYAAHLASNGKHLVAYQGFMSYAVFSGGIQPEEYMSRVFGKGGASKSSALAGIVGGALGALRSNSKTNSFYFGNSGYVKEMSYLVTRVFKRHDGRVQWYAEKAGIYAGAIEQMGKINRLSLIIDDSGSMAGAKLTSLKAALENLAVAIETSAIDIQQLNVSVFSDTSISVQASGRQNCATLVRQSINRLVAFGGTNAMAAFGGTVNYLTSPVKNDLVIVVSDGEMSNVSQAQAAIAHISAVSKIAGIGIGTVGSLASFHNISQAISVVQGDASQITKAILSVIQLFQLDYYDINPIHFIREILTDDRAMSIPESEINDENFRRAANVIHTEGLGISLQLEDKNCKEALDEVCGHIESGVRVNRQTGLYEVILFRDDWFDLDQAQHFTRSQINTLQIESSGGGVDDINTLNVKYNDREKNQDISFPVYNNGAKHNAGRENPEDINLMYFKSSRNANLVAAWKLKQMTTPTWSGSFTTSSYDARKLNRYDVIKISPGVHGISELPVRVTKIGLGNGSGSNEVSIDFVEVIPFSDEQYNPVIIEPPIVIDNSPTQADFIVHEVTYLEAVQQYGQREVDLQLQDNPDLGYLAVSAIRPKPQAMRAALHTDAGGGYSEKQAVFFCPSLTLDQDIGYMDALFAVKNPVDMENALPGLLIRIGEELMVFDEYDEETSLLRVKRGASPTVPKPHLKDAVFYFVDDFTYADPTQYITGEVVDAKVQTVMASSVQDINTADIKSLEIVGFMNRPYPPTNVLINGAYLPSYFEDDFTLTWSDRNRLQQTGGEILGYFEGSVVLEPNTQTLLTVTEYDVNDVELITHSINATASNSFTLLESAMQVDARSIHIILKTVRDGYECLYAFDHTVIRSTLVAPSNVTFEVIEY